MPVGPRRDTTRQPLDKAFERLRLHLCHARIDPRENVWPLVEAGKIKPVIHSTFAAEEAAKAHALMESNQHVGKIVLTW